MVAHGFYLLTICRYVVDSIEGHDWDAVDGCWKYKTKWVGWELATDRTWEPKENLEGANESLEEYWESIGGEPDPKGPPLKGTKKRARQSGVDSDTKKARISPQPPKSARSRKSELVDDPENWGPGDDKDWEPPKATKDAWEDSLIAVETIEPDEDGNHWAYLRWSILDKHGKHRHTKHPLAAVYKAAPQVMLKFYEKHLVFSGKPK